MTHSQADAVCKDSSVTRLPIRVRVRVLGLLWSSVRVCLWLRMAMSSGKVRAGLGRGKEVFVGVKRWRRREVLVWGSYGVVLRKARLMVF